MFQLLLFVLFLFANDLQSQTKPQIYWKNGIGIYRLSPTTYCYIKMRNNFNSYIIERWYFDVKTDECYHTLQQTPLFHAPSPELLTNKSKEEIHKQVTELADRFDKDYIPAARIKEIQMPSHFEKQAKKLKQNKIKRPLT